MASMSGFLAAKSKVSSQTCIKHNGMTITVTIKHLGRERSKSTAQPIEYADDLPTGHTLVLENHQEPAQLAIMCHVRGNFDPQVGEKLSE